MRVVQYGVHDPAYPRNARLREFLRERLRADVVVVRRARVGGRLARAVADVTGLWRASRQCDVILLAEFRLSHAPLAWGVARMRRVPLVVDRFVGLHETLVEDWRTVPPRSVRAALLHTQDRLAVRLADICVTDTACRAESLTREHSRPVLALPVGAPAWATPTPTPPTPMPMPAETTAADAGTDVEPGTRTTRYLYYGNYLPLHGVDVLVDVFAALAPRMRFTATFIGDGVGRAAVERALVAAGLADRVRFLDPVPETELPAHIADADVVFGVFGSSTKACTVVPNKVWQGLASGRVVVTRDGPAVRELADVVGAGLVLVDPSDPAGIAATLAALPPTRPAPTVAAALERFTASGYDTFAVVLDRVVHR